MEQYALYLVLKELLKDLDIDFKYSFNDMHSEVDRVVGIYVKGAEPSKYRALADGKYYNLTNRVQFLIQGGLDNESLMDCLSLASKIRDTLVGTNNKYMDVSDKIGYSEEGFVVLGNDDVDTKSIRLMITKVDILSDLVNIGKSKQGRPRYSINFKVSYGLGGNEDG